MSWWYLKVRGLPDHCDLLSRTSEIFKLLNQNILTKERQKYWNIIGCYWWHILIFNFTVFYPEHTEHEELNKFSTKTGNTEEKAIRNMSADIIIVLQDHCAGGKNTYNTYTFTIHFLQVVVVETNFYRTPCNIWYLLIFSIFLT